ncbi:MAG: NADP-dependent isocitrate dehydrogenase [Bacteroidetes bacterium]|nr:NADP-dependent isocitrate dehydrogenase [Bacteroidota bacterium]
MKHRITVAHGDGIGPEIMEATLKILEAANAPLEYDTIEIGEKVYLKGHTSGIEPAAWDSLRTNKVYLKAPITTPQGGGYKSLNVTTRKTLGLFSNVRPVRAYAPYVRTHHPDMNLVIVRENEEDCYAGIEHQQTPEVVQTLKLISKPGTEKIVRYAFEYAKANGRKKVTCMTKDNIMKHSDGLFHKIFDEIAAEYPEIENDHKIIDIGSALLADSPEKFDVVVTLNLYGDIISDIVAQIAGSVGMMGSSNIGEQCAMFEAIHGSAPDIAGKNIANPSGLLNGAIMMLNHLGLGTVASNIENAWLKTLEDGIHTGEIYKEGLSKEKVGTQEFAQAVIDRLGQKPSTFPVANYPDGEPLKLNTLTKRAERPEKKYVGVDVFVDFDGDANTIGDGLRAVKHDVLKLKLITNRGVKVYPDGMPETFCTDHWRCRFTNPDGKEIGHADIISLLEVLNSAGWDFIKTEQLCLFNGERGYSLAQGE